MLDWNGGGGSILDQVRAGEDDPDAENVGESPITPTDLAVWMQHALHLLRSHYPDNKVIREAHKRTSLALHVSALCFQKDSGMKMKHWSDVFGEHNKKPDIDDETHLQENGLLATYVRRAQSMPVKNTIVAMIKKSITSLPRNDLKKYQEMRTDIVTNLCDYEAVLPQEVTM